MSNSDFLSRTPPNDTVTERALLGAILKKPGILAGLLGKIEARDFYDVRNQRVFEAMVRLMAESEPIDAFMVVDALRRAGDLACFGDEKDAARLLIDSVILEGFPSFAESYARTIHDLALIRDCGSTAYNLAMRSFDAGDAREFLANGQTELAKVYARQVSERPELPAVLTRVLDAIGQPDDAGFPTGFRDFDDTLNGGFRPGQLIVLAGQTSKGKSALALNIAANFARQGRPALFFSLEMPEEQLARRLLFAEAQVSLRRMRFPNADENERLLYADSKLRDLPLSIQYRPGLRPLEVRAEAQRRRAQWGGLSLIVVDYVGLAQPDTKQERREREVASITRELKLIAGELNCVVIACAQLNREVDHRENAKPRLSDLRDSGALEQDCDTAAFISQPDPDDNARRITILKNRDGALGEFTLSFRPEMVRFENLGADAQGEEAAA